MTIVRALWLCFVCLLAACAGRLDRPSALTRARLEQHAALAADDHPARARFAYDLGLGPDAVFHASRWLEQAQATEDIARATGVRGRALRDASKDRKRAARMALEAGRRFGYGDVVIEATLATGRPSMDDLEWGCTHTDFWGGDDVELLETAERDPEAWLAAWTLVASEDVPLDELEDQGYTPSGTVLRGLDARGNAVRWAMLDAELSRGGLTQRAVELAATIAKLDPSDVRARGLLLLRADMKDGSLIVDTDLLTDHSATWSSISALSRARRRFETFEDAPAAKLHYAHLLLQRELSGDAVAVVRTGEGTWKTDEQRDLARLIEALAEVRRGAPEAFASWMDEHDGTSTLAADQALSMWWLRTMGVSAENPAPGALGESLQAAAIRRVELRDRSMSEEDMLRAWVSERLSRRSRAWVRGQLGALAPLVEMCLDEEGTPQACARLVSAPAEQANIAVTQRGLRHGAGAALVHHIDGADLDDLGWTKLEGMRETTLALSSGFTSAYVEGLVARGQLEDADAWLLEFGNTLTPGRLAGLQLTLADQFAGRGDEQEPRWMRLSERWPADRVFASQLAEGDVAPVDPRAPWPEQMLTASNNVAAEAYADAEAIYLRLAATAPAPAKSMLMALAARAALEAGHPDRATTHLTTVPADDPQRLIVEALVAHERGDTASAHDKILRAWPRQSAAARHVVHLNVPLDAQLGLEVIERHGWMGPYLSWALERGSIVNLEALALALRAAEDGAYAWEHAESLVPELLSVAALFGTQRLREATRVEDARPIATKVIELQRRMPYPPREQMIDLMLVTGEHDEGLSLARNEVPEEGIVPLASTHALVRLHTAGLEGSVSAQTLWHEWRWRNGVGSEAEHQGLLTKPGSLLGYACMQLSEIPDDPRALRTCERAWKAEKQDSWQSAVNYSYLLLQPEVPSPEALAAVFAGSPPPPYRVAAPPMRDRSDVAVLHQNLSAWLALGGQDERAAQARIDGYAYAFVEDAYDNRVPESEYRYRGEHARAATLASRDTDGATLYARLAYQSLRGLEPALAQHYAAVSLALPEDPATRAGPLAASRAADLALLVAEDQAADRAPAEALEEAVSAAFERADTSEALEQLFIAHEASATVRVVAAEGMVEVGSPEDALMMLEDLEKSHPTHPLVAVVGARARVALDDEDGAKKRFAVAQAANPNSRTLTYASLPESVLGARPTVPDWMRTPEAFDTRLTSVSLEDMLALAPRYRSHTEIAADGFFPLAWEARDEEPLSAQSNQGESVSISQEARASRCVGEECLRSTLDSLQRRGFTLHFVRSTTVSAGEVTEATLSDISTVWTIASVPVGGRVFTIVGSAPHARADSMLTAFAMLRQSFAPLDAVVPAFGAASLRVDGTSIVDRVRLRARLEDADAGCPAPKTLAEAPGAARAELLLDLFLSTPDVETRRRVLTCAKPSDRAARRTALVALLDDDARIHAWGREAVHRNASRVLADAKHVLPMDVPVSAPDYFERSESGPRGRIELGLALPEPTARRFVADLITRKDAQARVDGWVIATQRPSVASLEAADTLARSGDAHEAALALDVLELRDRERYASALRARFDALDPKAVTPERSWEPRSLAYGLAYLLDPADTARLRAAKTRFAGGKDDDLERSMKTLAKWHAEAIAAAKGEKPVETAEPFNILQQTEVHTAAKPRSRKLLESQPLSKLLPSRHWTFARVASPGLFASTVVDLMHRLDPADATQRLMLDRAVDTMLENSGFDALLEGGGLDLSAPIECATMAGDGGFVCSGTVKDREALLTEFGRRGHDSDAGLAIVLQLSRGAGLLPVGLSVLPVLMHAILYEDPDEPEDRKEPAPPRFERFRHRVEVAGYDLHYYAIIRADEDSVSTDAERYLFLGDRVFVFSNDFMARRVLLEPHDGTAALAADTEFRALTSAWKDGSALQAAAMGMSSPIDDTSVASELVADGKGAAFRYSASTDEELGDMTAAAARLPPGAVSTLVVGYPKQDDDDDLPELEELELAEGDILPPAQLLPASSGAAFGWYPAPGDSLWRRWLLVLPQNPLLRKASKKAGARAPTRAAKRAKAGWWYAETDGLLLLSSDEDLMRTAIDRPTSATGGEYLLGRGTFDGPRAAAVVERLPSTSASVERVILRFFAGAVGIVENGGFEATWNPKTKVGTMSGRVSLRLQDRDSSEVIDQWLAAARFRNAAALPRRLEADEAEGTLRLTVRVDDAEAFVRRSVFPSARVKSRVIDDTHVELTVRAKALDADATEVLSKARKKALLDTSDDLRIRDESIVAVRKTLTQPAMSPQAKAKAITNWVHERIDYEVTPRSLDSTQILRVGRGDCSEYALLSVALLRSAGVPAEVRSGMAAQGDDMVAHAWVAYHDGKRWHEVDPTWGRLSVTAGHLPLEVTDILALVSLDRFEIETITALD